MASRYSFSQEEIRAIENACGASGNKRAQVRLRALELRAKGKTAREVAEATGFHACSVARLVAKYRDRGLEAISGNHYGGNHRIISAREEAALLAPFRERADRGEAVPLREIAAAYEKAAGHPVSQGQVYAVLRRNGWHGKTPPGGNTTG